MNQRARRCFELELVGVIVLLGSAALAVFAFTPRAFSELYGIRLGFTAEQVQSRFTLSSRGHWRPSQGCDVPSLTWRSVGPTATAVEQARFDFHAGLLVAMRLRLSAGDAAVREQPPIEERAASLVLRRVEADGVAELAWLSRDCAWHVAELSHALRQQKSRR